LYLRDYGRYESLITGATTYDPRSSRKPSSVLSQDTAAEQSCHPGLVSFVGQTGAGKSTLIKLLIRTAKHELARTAPAPISGDSEHTMSTTAGIHLYADPNTAGSDKPILYADSQGLDGGTTEPIALRYRRARSSVASTESFTSLDTQYSNNEKIRWANDDTTRSIEYAVNRLYPRILFTFSHVVLFIHRNPRYDLC
jgi:energy-coupling factor transporter ATP-binding protein EcfA2